MIRSGDYLSINQVLEVVPTSRSMLYRLRKIRPDLFRKLGNRVLIDMRILESMIEEVRSDG